MNQRGISSVGGEFPFQKKHYCFSTYVLFYLLSFRITPSLKKRLLSAYNLDKVAAIQWGVIHEAKAIEEYCKLGGIVNTTGKLSLIAYSETFGAQLFIMKHNNGIKHSILVVITVLKWLF